MRPNIYKILDRAIEEGIECGWNRSHKHDEKPNPSHIKDQIHMDILGSICEIFDFDEINDDVPKVKYSKVMREVRLTMTKEAWAHNEWLRLYIEEPENFETEFKSVRDFIKESKGGEPSHGEKCEAFMQELIKRAPETEKERTDTFVNWNPEGW